MQDDSVGYLLFNLVHVEGPPPEHGSIFNIQPDRRKRKAHNPEISDKRPKFTGNDGYATPSVHTSSCADADSVRELRT
jgi:hypothetical protein